MPQPLLWAKINASGDEPSARSGHSMTTVGNSYVMFGGLYVPSDPKKPATNAIPTDEVYTLRIGLKEAHWSKEKTSGDERPSARTQHTAIGISEKKLWVFGGHSVDDESENGLKNLNDTYILDTGSMDWSNPVKQEALSSNAIPQEENKSEDGADEGEAFSHDGEVIPHPRANTASAFIDGKVYIFGGHGGLGYQRKAFNDLWSFDIETGCWRRMPYKNNA